jgi:hypothetical protein
MVIVCINCDSRIYDCLAIGRDFTGDRVLSEDFVPLDSTIAPPMEGEELICPFCGNRFFHSTPPGGVLLKLENGAWWPHPPIK